MNIKERLQNLKKENSISIKEDYSASLFFQKEDTLENIFVKAFNNNKNFILVCDKDCDKEIICDYFKKFIRNKESVETLHNTTDDIQFSIATKIIVTEPKIKDIINILKLSINDFKTFLFAIHLKNFETTIKSLSTLISIELPNLKNENINHLIGSSEAIVVYISKNEDDFYYIKNIGEIEYKDEKPILKDIYNKEIKEISEEEITITNKTSEKEQEKEIEIEIENNTKKEPEKKLKIELDFSKNKKNKYKLLKEKIKKSKSK